MSGPNAITYAPCFASVAPTGVGISASILNVIPALFSVTPTGKHPAASVRFTAPGPKLCACPNKAFYHVRQRSAMSLHLTPRQTRAGVGIAPQGVNIQPSIIYISPYGVNVSPQGAALNSLKRPGLDPNL